MALGKKKGFFSSNCLTKIVHSNNNKNYTTNHPVLCDLDYVNRNVEM